MTLADTAAATSDDLARTYAGRRDRLRTAAAERFGDGVVGLYLTGRENIRYASGFTGSFGAVLVGPEPGGDVLFTDGRYDERAEAEAPGLARRIGGPLSAALATCLRERGSDADEPVLLVETHVITVDEHAVLGGALSGVRLESAARLVETARVVKDELELAYLRTACRISTDALTALLAAGPVSGRTERELARDLENRMLDLGADGLAFPTILAGGPHAAIPHHDPGDRPVAIGDLVKIDFGALAGGYHADCTRTFIVGGDPAGWQQEIHAVVQAAQAAGVAAAVDGAAVADVDAAARDVVTEAGYAESFTHGLGHGVGLAIHEDPFLSASSTHTLGRNTPITVEPGIYLPGRGGVRIEDTVVVRAGKAPEVLTSGLSTELVSVD